MTELLQQTYYGNSLQAWLISLGIIAGAVILGKLAYWIFSKVVTAFSSRTESRLDDIIIDMVEKPAVFFIVVSGIWFALNRLVLPETLATAISGAYQMIYALLIAWLLSRLFEAIYQEYLLPLVESSDNDLDDQLMPVIRKMVRITIWTLAVIIGLDNAGYDVGALLAGLGIGGLAMAMAAKDTVSNMFGGATIFTDKPFRVGDRIVVAGFDGTVEEIGIRSTRLRTLAGRIVTIPNSQCADTPVENISSEPSRKVVLNLGLTYDTKPEQMQQAMDLLRAINNGSENTEDKTIISFDGFGDFALNIMFAYYIRSTADIPSTQTEISMAILSQFNQNGLEFAFPTQTLYNIEATPA